ncbi:MAG: hypothetical protein LQ337_005315 [Flavoplaca oasis]|nr:MAG: hypothetical protein LQ337_005315 [Flavoplaca oasis]
MDYVADSANLCNRDVDLTNIDVSDYEGVIIGHDRREEEDLLAESPHADVVTDEPGSVPTTSNTPWTDEMNDLGAVPAYAHDSDAWIRQMTSEDFDRAITEYFTSQAREETSLSLRTRTDVGVSYRRYFGFPDDNLQGTFTPFLFRSGLSKRIYEVEIRFFILLNV